jgi:hypothetical protein
VHEARTHSPPRQALVPPGGSAHRLHVEPQAFLLASLGVGGQPEASSLPLTHRLVPLPHAFEQSGSVAKSSTFPLQSLSRPSHTSAVREVVALQAPSQRTNPGAHEPLQRASFAMHCWPQGRKPESHRKSHDTPAQTGVPWAGVGHGAHESPHEVMLLLSLHWSPHWWNPPLQEKEQVPLVQTGVALAGGRQGLQLSQKLTSLGSMQSPLQFFCPPAHTLLQGSLREMHLPEQIWVLGGHCVPHIVPSQVALPPEGSGHALHEAPHVAGSLSLTHASSQRW